jgi:hypothetical protein
MLWWDNQKQCFNETTTIWSDTLAQRFGRPTKGNALIDHQKWKHWSGQPEATCWSDMLSLSSSLSTITTPLYIHSMKNLEWQEQTLNFEDHDTHCDVPWNGHFDRDNLRTSWSKTLIGTQWSHMLIGNAETIQQPFNDPRKRPLWSRKP